MFGWAGIESYEPVFYNTENTFVEANKDLLNSIYGAYLEQIFWMWDKRDSEWITDFPVILKLNTMQISVCNNKLDEIALGCNDIDMSKPLEPYWYDVVGYDLEWKKFNDFEGSLILPDKIDCCKIILEKTYLFGIDFCIGNGVLEVTNGLDCNNIGFYVNP